MAGTSNACLFAAGNVEFLAVAMWIEHTNCLGDESRCNHHVCCVGSVAIY